MSQSISLATKTPLVKILRLIHAIIPNSVFEKSTEIIARVITRWRIFRLVLISLLNGISTFVGYLMPKPSRSKNRGGIIQLIARKDKGVDIFLKDISPEVNVIARLEFELTYYEPGVLHFNHYTTGTSPRIFNLQRKDRSDTTCLNP